MCTSVTMWTGLLILVSCGVALSENKYNDSGIVLTAIPITLDGYRDVVVIPTTPLELVNYTGDFNGFNFNNINKQVVSCDVDYDMNHLYIFDYDSRSILLGENWNSSAMLSEITFTVQHYGVSSDYVKLAVDWVSHNIYWTEPLMTWIAMQPGGAINDTTLYKVIVRTGLEYPTGLAVDPLAGYLFWVDNGNTPKIERSNLVGEERQILVSRRLVRVYSIVADPASKRIYWTNYNTIDSANYDGTARKHIRTSAYAAFFDVALFENVLMVTDANEEFLYFFDKTDGTSVSPKLGSDKEVYLGICMYHSQNQPKSPDQDRCKSHGCQHMCVNEPTKSTCLCKEGFTLNDDGKTCTEAEGKHFRGVVLNTRQELCIVDIRVLVDHHDFLPTCFYNGTVDENITHIELNMKTREVYFSVRGSIYRVKIDGGPNSRTLLTEQNKNITGMSYDWVNNHLYYSINETEGTPDSIWIMDPDTGFTQKHQEETGDDVMGLLVVPHERRVFWIGNKTELFESDLGINPQWMNKVELGKELVDPLSMIHDTKQELLYVLDAREVDRHTVMMLNYSGSFDRSLMLDTTVNDIAVYKMYLVFLQQSGEDSILRSSFLSRLSTVDRGKVKGLKNAYGIKVLDPDLQIEYPSPCGTTATYGGCEQICVPNEDAAVCDCTMGFDLHENGTSCVSQPMSDNFLLASVAAYIEILQISLDEPAKSIGIKAPDVGMVTSGVMYNHLTDMVVWSSRSKMEINGVHLNGSNHKILGKTSSDLAFPDQFALDPSTGNIYFTADSLFTNFLKDSFVGVIGPNGQMTTINSESHRPRSIALHPGRGQYYLTESGDNPGIYRANMDGSNFENLISEDIVWPFSVAIDYEEDRLYWTDGYLDKIFSSDLDGGDRIEVLADPKTNLVDVVVMGDYLYYTAREKAYITKVHKLNTSDVENVGPESGLGQIQALTIYSKAASQKLPKNEICSKNNGGCSDLCLPTPTGATCACDDMYDLLPDGKTCENVPRCPKYLSTATVEDSDTCLRLPGNQCNFTCKENHRRKNGVSLITCSDEEGEDFEENEEYRWNNDEPCEEILCTARLSHAFIDKECNRSVGDECGRFTCAPGYERNTSTVGVKCLETGEWDMADYMCIERCPQLSIVDHNVELVSTCRRQPGEVCQFFCNSMYTNALPYSSIRCLSGSRWNVSTQSLCKEIVCPDFFQNGFVSRSCSRKEKVVCSFECMDRYQPNPKIEQITCDRGVWDFMKGQDWPCQAIPAPPAKEPNAAKDIGIGAGVGAGVILLIVIIIIVVLFRSGRLPSHKSSSHSMFENPRYVAGDVNINTTGQESNKDFGYTTMEEETVRVTNEYANANPSRQLTN